MKNLLTSLKSGNWRSLVACFLYFDTGFTVWVLYGPLAPFISKRHHDDRRAAGLSRRGAGAGGRDPARDTRQPVPIGTDGRRVALMGVAALGHPDHCPAAVVRHAVVLACCWCSACSSAWAARASRSLCRWPAATIRRRCRAWCSDWLQRATSARCWTASCSPISPMPSAGKLATAGRLAVARDHSDCAVRVGIGWWS